MASPSRRADMRPDLSHYDEIVQINIGEPREPYLNSFSVHKGILSFYSGFFATTFAFAESPIDVITLPDENADLFRRFIGWAYSRQLEVGSGAEAVRMLGRMWVFAHRRDVPVLKNGCITLLMDMVAASGEAPSLHLAYVNENTTAESGLRQLVRDIVVALGTPGLLDPEKGNWTPQAMQDVLASVWSLQSCSKLNGKGLRDLVLCYYHEHEDGARCALRDPTLIIASSTSYYL